MLTLEIKHLVALRGGRKVVPFLVKSGMPRARARMVEKGSNIKMLRDDTVRELCEALDCMPNDLFAWRGPAEHWLSELNAAPLRRLEDVFLHTSHAELEKLWAELLERDAMREEKVAVKGGRVWLNVRRLMEMRSASRPALTLQRLGMKEMVARNVTELARKDGQMAVKMPVLTWLCMHLGCYPNDLYDFVGPQGHVLDGLRKTPIADLTELIERMTPEEARRLLGK
jgi:DNA-binding Xre family transcriptional regulator